MEVLIGVITCEANVQRADAVRQTWGAACSYPLVYADGKTLGCDDSYEGLPEKVKSLCAYALENGYDWLLKIDDDTMLFPQRLVVPTSGDYIGRVRGALTRLSGYPGSYCSGGAYWLSRRAMEIIAAAPLDPAMTFEDCWVGNVLYHQGVTPISQPHFVAPTHIPKSDYIKNNQQMQVLMQVDNNESPEQMLRWWNGDYDPQPHASGSNRDDFPVGSDMWRARQR